MKSLRTMNRILSDQVSNIFIFFLHRNIWKTEYHTWYHYFFKTIFILTHKSRSYLALINNLQAEEETCFRKSLRLKSRRAPVCLAGYAKPDTTPLRRCTESPSHQDSQSPLSRNSLTFCSRSSLRFASEYQKSAILLLWQAIKLIII